ncbi:hypothetical protein PI124_g10369 [Phytophthora idaei]|nr:hypothetical protein PI125_g9918 [Phytophthora idaei]KAG3157715.1 hypothetical protein PI126_g8159 [Phytophthora idaei]KAG3244851.1 hypothetical protein PI124_g10369 [Phytophthora idaei]
MSLNMPTLDPDTPQQCLNPTPFALSGDASRVFVPPAPQTDALCLVPFNTMHFDPCIHPV